MPLRVLVLSLLGGLLFCQEANAELKRAAGILVGANFYKYSVTEKVRYSPDQKRAFDLNRGFSMAGGFTGEYKFTKYFYFQTDLIWAEKKGSSSEHRVSALWLDIPLLAKAKYDFGHSFVPFIHLGPAPSFKLTEDFNIGNLKSFAWAGIFGLGTDYNMSEKFYLFIDFRFFKIFGDLVEDPKQPASYSGPSALTYDSKLSGFEVYLGSRYRF